MAKYFYAIPIEDISTAGMQPCQVRFDCLPTPVLAWYQILHITNLSLQIAIEENDYKYDNHLVTSNNLGCRGC